LDTSTGDTGRRHPAGAAHCCDERSKRCARSRPLEGRSGGCS